MNLFKSFREREQMAFQGLSLSVETLIKAFIIGVKKSTMPIQAFHHKVIFRSGFICLYNYGTSWYFFQWISCHIDPSVAQVYRKTLHKALRTRGLSSADQSNFFRSIHKFLNKSWSNFILRISIKHQLQNLNQTSASWLNYNLKILTRPSFRISTKQQLHDLNQASAATYWPKFSSKINTVFFSNVDNLFAALCSCWQHSQASRNLEKLFKALRNCMLLNFFSISSSEWSIRRCLHSFASFRFERNCSCKEPPTYYVINKIGSSHVLLHRCHLGKESQSVS